MDEWQRAFLYLLEIRLERKIANGDASDLDSTPMTQLITLGGVSRWKRKFKYTLKFSAKANNYKKFVNKTDYPNEYKLLKAMEHQHSIDIIRRQSIIHYLHPEDPNKYKS